MTDPFDTSLYDWLEVEADNHAPTSENMPTAHRRYIFSAWYAGWDACAEVAARISAEREQVPASDEELASIFADAIEAAYTRNPSETDGQHIIAGIRAVRAAIAPQVPVIPEGWRLRHIRPVGPQYRAVLDWEDWKSVSAMATNPNDALTAAIETAKENGHE